MTDPAIHVFLGSLDEIDIPDIRNVCAELLCPRETQQAGRFTSDRRAREYVYAHALVRAALSRFAPDVPPAVWRFARNRNGRPFICYPQYVDLLYFSLSHTDGFVACAVSRCERVGIDVEATDRSASHLEIARTFFSPAEFADLVSLPSARQADRFFDYWTLKEAYAKARGMGLQLPLNGFSIHMAPEGTLGISFSRDLRDDPEDWCFSRFSPTPRHRLAIADGSGSCLPLIFQPWPIQSRAACVV